MTESGGGTALYAWLADAVDANAAIITSSRRLARELRAEHDRKQISAGRKAWPTPQIQFWQDWLTVLYQSSPSSNPRTLIDANASTILWEISIGEHLDDAMISSYGLLSQARAAWQRLQEWRVTSAELTREARSSDEIAFAKAARSYRDMLLKNHWMDTGQVVAAVIEDIRAGRITVADHFVYAGFDRISPIVEELFQSMRDSGSNVVEAGQRATATTLTTASYAGVEAEMRAAGAWARRRLLENPVARIAVVATSLESESARYARLIREGLAPGWQGESDAFRHSVDVSYGRKLSDYPAIHVALLCLSWTQRGLISRDVSVLLRSPSLGAGDPSHRSGLELQLRRLPDRKWTAPALVEALDAPRISSSSQEWLKCVRRISDQHILTGQKYSPAKWAGRIDEFLTSIGWPGEGAMKSDEFQLLNRWRNLLNEFGGLDRVMPSMTFSEGVRHLDRLAGEIIFQPDTPDSLVSLLGSLEAAGMEFDHLWVAGMDSQRWPASGQPMALVSRRLQRRHAMPDSSPQDSLEYSRRVLGRLAASAGAVHFSWSRADQDTTQMVSPLLEEIQAQAVDDFDDPYWYAENLFGAAETRDYADDPAPAIDGVERIDGGAYTVQRQTVEPFSAFAHGRLGIRELGHFVEGLSPSLRGSLLHDSLHQLLIERPSRTDIADWSESDSLKRIETAIGNAFSEPLRNADAVLRRLMAMERIRLRDVIVQFLETEMSRPEFHIYQVEERIDFEHAGVRLSLRADRIDRLEDGTLLIIDYKTGQVKNLLGRDGDPVDLQVVVYAAAIPQEVGGLALVNVGSREIVYKGVGGSVEWGKVTADDWPELLLRWKASVHSAMEQIAQGDVQINLQRTTEQSRPLNILSRVEEHKRAS